MRLMHNASKMDFLKSSLRALVADIPPGSKIAYLDQPVHLNIGDLLINQGLERLLLESDLEPDIRFSVYDYAQLKRRITRDHIVVLHGGGNFGDLWPEHEALRQKVMRDLINNRIILFPQSIYFRSLGQAKKYSAAYREHPNFTMYVRDRESASFAEEHMGIKCRLSPDTAHQLWGLFDAQQAPCDGDLKFYRRDLEAAADSMRGGVDWADIGSYVDKPKQLMFRYAMTVNRSLSVQSILMNQWYHQRDMLVSKAVKYFAQYRSVTTSRLHGAILGSLLGMDVSIVDNSYGKLSRYCRQWMTD
jgi:pyruvyl transferase EpsO